MFRVLIDSFTQPSVHNDSRRVHYVGRKSHALRSASVATSHLLSNISVSPFINVHVNWRLLSRRSRQRERLYATGLSICSSVYLSVCLLPKYKNSIFSKTKQFRAMVSIDEVIHGLFKEPVIRPLKSNIAEIRPKMQKRDFLKNVQFTAMVSIADL